MSANRSNTASDRARGPAQNRACPHRRRLRHCESPHKRTAVGEAKPAGHSKHAVRLVTLAKVPAAHGCGEGVPAVGAKKPGCVARQSSDWIGDQKPRGHCSQPVAICRVPAEQLPQLAPSRLTRPAGQSRQTVALAALNVLPGHRTHVSAAAPVVTDVFWKKPASQTRHSPPSCRSPGLHTMQRLLRSSGTPMYRGGHVRQLERPSESA